MSFQTVAWIGFLGFTALATMVWTQLRFNDDRADSGRAGMSYAFFYALLAVLIPSMTAIMYLFVALGYGSIEIGSRTVIWLRYFEWGVTTPLLFIGVTVLSANAALTARIMFWAALLIAGGFLGALTLNPVFIIASIAPFLAILYLLLKETATGMQEYPAGFQDLFASLRNLALAVFPLYPVVWLLSEHAVGVLSVTQSMTLFLGLDIIVKAGFVVLVMRNTGTLGVRHPTSRIRGLPDQVLGD